MSPWTTTPYVGPAPPRVEGPTRNPLWFFLVGPTLQSSHSSFPLFSFPLFNIYRTCHQHVLEGIGQQLTPRSNATPLPQSNFLVSTVRPLPKSSLGHSTPKIKNYTTYIWSLFHYIYWNHLWWTKASLWRLMGPTRDIKICATRPSSFVWRCVWKPGDSRTQICSTSSSVFPTPAPPSPPPKK